MFGSETDCTASAEAANDPTVVPPLPPLMRSSGNPYMTPDEGDECHAHGWNDAEIYAFINRATRFASIGREDADDLAERLTLRDRQADVRRMCVECLKLDSLGCAVARRTTFLGAEPLLDPAQNCLVHCTAFQARMAVRVHKRQ